MKIYTIAVCVIAAVSADVSHLTGSGYNYDKPSVAFNLPRPTPLAHQHLPRPATTYLPAGQTQYTGPHHDYTHSVIGGPSNEYLTSQPQYLGPVDQQYEFPQTISTPQQQFTVPTEPISVPSNEYLPSQLQTFRPTLAPFDVNQPQYTTPTFTPDYQQPISTPNSEYLPPQTQHSVARQQPFEHNAQPIQAPASEYLPSRQQQQQHHTTPVGHQHISPHQNYLPPQQQHQQFPQTHSTPHIEYLPPHEHQQHQQQQQYHHQQHQQHHQHYDYQHDNQGQVQNDGYHYNVPAKRFRF